MNRLQPSIREGVISEFQVASCSWYSWFIWCACLNGDVFLVCICACICAGVFGSEWVIVDITYNTFYWCAAMQYLCHEAPTELRVTTLNSCSISSTCGGVLPCVVLFIQWKMSQRFSFVCFWRLNVTRCALGDEGKNSMYEIISAVRICGSNVPLQ